MRSAGEAVCKASYAVREARKAPPVSSVLYHNITDSLSRLKIFQFIE